MKILNSSEYIFTRAGIVRLNSTRTALIKALINNAIFICLLGPVLGITSGAFVYYHFDQFVNAINSIIIFWAGVIGCGKYIFLKWNEKNIKNLIKNFPKLVDEGSLSWSSHVTADAEITLYFLSFSHSPHHFKNIL